MSTVDSETAAPRPEPVQLSLSSVRVSPPGRPMSTAPRFTTSLAGAARPWCCCTAFPRTGSSGGGSCRACRSDSQSSRPTCAA